VILLPEVRLSQSSRVSFQRTTTESEARYPAQKMKTTMLLSTLLAVGVALVQDALAVENIALGKPAYQSTDLDDGSTAGEYSRPGLAVDGDTNNNVQYSNPDKSSCTHTSITDKANPWWAVDLGDIYEVTGVKIYNRAQGYDQRLHDMNIGMTYRNPNNFQGEARTSVLDMRLCTHHVGPVEIGGKQIDCDQPAVGRFLLVQIPGDNEILTLCEIEVFGEIALP